MNSLKNKILLVCDICKRVKLVNRVEEDLTGSIFVILDCEKCLKEGMKEHTTHYYDKKGIMNYRDGIWNE